MLTVLREERYAGFRLNTLSVDQLLDLVGVVLSAKDLNGERKFLDLKTAFHEGINNNTAEEDSLLRGGYEGYRFYVHLADPSAEFFGRLCSVSLLFEANRRGRGKLRL